MEKGKNLVELSSLSNAYYKDNDIAIYQGDALSVLRDMPDNIADCVITSPPYWGLRDYGTPPQIWDGHPNCNHDWGDKQLHPSRGNRGEGVDPKHKSAGIKQPTIVDSQFCLRCGAWRGSLGLESTFELYVKHLCNIFDEIKRVLKEEGTLWVNLGDTYSGSHQGYGKNTLTRLSEKKNENLGSVDSYLQKYNHTIDRPPPSAKTSLPDKCLCMIPARVAIEMSNRGWILRNDIIWHKPSCMPQSVCDRFTVDYEHVFLFAKNRHYHFKQQFEPFKESSLSRAKYGSYSKKTDMGIHGGMTLKTQLEVFRKIDTGELPGRNKRCVWTIASQSFKGKHFAVFPENLIKPMIGAGCPDSGIVLDPFTGSGTAGLVAKKLGRRFIGIELSEKYIDEIIMPRLAGVAVLV